MPIRNNSIIRRDVNRLNELILKHKENEIALQAVSEVVAAHTEKVNTAWQAYQSAAVSGDKERDERDSAITELLSWIQRWRPVIMIKIPGAGNNIRQLPSQGSTPDDVIRVAEDMLAFVSGNEAGQDFAESMTTDLGDKLEEAKKETSEATTALPHEAVCRHNFTEACIAANAILVRGLEIVRSTFGRTSPEYKQFIARSSAKKEEETEEVVEVV